MIVLTIRIREFGTIRNLCPVLSYYKGKNLETSLRTWFDEDQIQNHLSKVPKPKTFLIT